MPNTVCYEATFLTCDSIQFTKSVIWINTSYPIQRTLDRSLQISSTTILPHSDTKKKKTKNSNPKQRKALHHKIGRQTTNFICRKWCGNRTGRGILQINSGNAALRNISLGGKYLHGETEEWKLLVLPRYYFRDLSSRISIGLDQKPKRDVKMNMRIPRLHLIVVGNWQNIRGLHWKGNNKKAVIRLKEIYLYICNLQMMKENFKKDWIKNDCELC